MAKRSAWLILILLAAASLRLAAIDRAPPGLTHDEADHGLAAWGVVQGIRPIYFTVGYGREPLYDYATSILMTFMGPSFLAGRLTSVFLSLILLAATYAWANRAFGRKTALLVASGLGLSFWAVMTGRQALRSITLPAVFVLAVYFFWRAIEMSSSASDGPGRSGLFHRWPGFSRFALAGLLLGLTLYTYVPARVMWLLFPIMLTLLFAYDRRRLRAVWPGTLLALGLALLLATPLLLYLNANPGVEERITELSGPLSAARHGDLEPLLKNVGESVLLPTFKGDGQWRYNIPGQPLLPPALAVFFYVGLAIGLVWLLRGGRKEPDAHRPADARLPRQVGYLFALAWLILGLSPALVSGPDLSTTRAIAAQPVIYVFPAIALSAILSWKTLPRRVTAGLIVLLFVGFGLQTAGDYFIRWAQAPQVRVQYETSLVQTLAYIRSQVSMATAISTTTPNKYHSPAVATLMLADEDNGLRWFDGNYSLLLPQADESRIIFSGFAPLNPHLSAYFDFAPVAAVLVNEDDADQPIWVFEVDGRRLGASWLDSFDVALAGASIARAPVRFGDSLEYLGYQRLEAGEADQLLIATLWRALRPLNQAMLFTHLLGPDGRPLAQDDRLDVPGESWLSGDLFIQLHQIDLASVEPDRAYPLAVGVYTTDTMQRLPILVDGQEYGDHLLLPEVTINQ
jgi:4-amino-4-deoxy-L-arabinose transferase-like glycosyltransferase